MELEQETEINMTELAKSLFKNVEIFGFSGKLGTGKNFIAEKVFSSMMPQKQTVVMSFADQIKVSGIVQHGLDRYKCFVEKDDHTRRTLQRIGTEEGRNVYGEDIWIRYTLEWMMVYANRGAKRIIITDVRFKNEFDFIKSLGGTMIRVNALKRNRAALEREASKNNVDIERIASHQSETDLDDGREFDFKIENNPEHNAFIQVRDMVKKIHENKKEELVIFCDLDNTICECNLYYISQSEKAKDLIKSNLKYIIQDEVFNDMYFESVRKHNGEYSHSYFYMEKFAESMCRVFDDFKKYLNDNCNTEELRNKIYEWGMQVFDYSYKAIKQRAEELKEISSKRRVVIFTMGDRLEQVKKIVELGLGDLDFEVYDFKDETIFRNLKHKYPAYHYCMIGDSLERDVKPALEAGVQLVVKISDKKESYWYAKEGETKEIPYHQINELSEFTPILENYLAKSVIE